MSNETSLTDNMLDLIEQHSVSHASNDSEGIKDEFAEITGALNHVLATHVLNVACHNSKMSKDDLSEESWFALENVVKKFAASSLDELIGMVCSRYLNHL